MWNYFGCCGGGETPPTAELGLRVTAPPSLPLGRSQWTQPRSLADVWVGRFTHLLNNFGITLLKNFCSSEFDNLGSNTSFSPSPSPPTSPSTPTFLLTEQMGKQQQSTMFFCSLLPSKVKNAAKKVICMK